MSRQTSVELATTAVSHAAAADTMTSHSPVRRSYAKPAARLVPCGVDQIRSDWPNVGAKTIVAVVRMTSSVRVDVAAAAPCDIRHALASEASAPRSFRSVAARWKK